MLDKLIKLPGNLLRNLVGILPHDDPETGTTTGYKDGDEGHFKTWCEGMGGKVVGPGLCGFEVQDQQYKELHNQLYKMTGEEMNPAQESKFIKQYNEFKENPEAYLDKYKRQ